MKVILDARKLRMKEQAHRYLKEQLAFPEYYGNNLDALQDCLEELEIEVEIAHWDEVEAGGYHEQVLRVMQASDIQVHVK